MTADLAQPGFADPVAGAQICFRALLDAMARPGQVHTVGAGLTPPAPLDAATAAVLLTLTDHETPLWLDTAASTAAGWIGFHCGAPIVATAADCRYAAALALPDLAHLPAGTHEAPETSATLILQLPAIGQGTRYRLAGPGLRAPTQLAIAGLPADFPTIWQRNHEQFPRGVDIVLCAGDRLAALPRSVMLQET